MATKPQPRIKTDETEIVIKPRENHFSLLWTVEDFVNNDMIFDVCEEKSIAPDTEVILYTDESESNEKVDLRDAISRLETETAQFIRINANDFTLTWEYKSDQDITIIGFVSDEIYGRVIRSLYSRSFDQRLSDEAQEGIKEAVHGSSTRFSER